MSFFIILSANATDTISYGCFCDDTGNIFSYRQTVNSNASDLDADGGVVVLSKPTNDPKEQILYTPGMEEIGFIRNVTSTVAEVNFTKFSPPIVAYAQVENDRFLTDPSSSQIYTFLDAFDSIYYCSYMKEKFRLAPFNFVLQGKIIPRPQSCPRSSPYLYGTNINFVYNVDTIQSNFPIDISKFFFFYENLLPASVKDIVVPTIKKNPCQYGDFFRSINAEFDLCNALWAYQYAVSYLPSDVLPPNDAPKVPFTYSSGISSNKWVEITHCCCDFLGNGYFFYVAIGSGIWYNVGKTIVFPDHIDAYCFFYNVRKDSLSQFDIQCLNGGGSLSNTLDAKNARAANAAGYDSIQFTYRYEKNEVTGNGEYKYEIQDCRFLGSQKDSPCFDDILKPFIRAGWWKTELPGEPPLECVCIPDDPNKPCLNCQNQILGKCPQKQESDIITRGVN